MGGELLLFFFYDSQADIVFHASVNLNESQILEETLSTAYLF